MKAVPDRAQYPVRVRALRAGKLLYMAVPRLAQARPFYVLDPGKLTVGPEQAADTATAARLAPTADVAVMRPVDLVVCGSVAVNRAGARLGKGAGYSDIEMAILAEAGLLTEAIAYPPALPLFRVATRITFRPSGVMAIWPPPPREL